MSNLAERLEARYYTSFLPLILARDTAELQPYLHDTTARWWGGSNGKVALFLPPPPKIKDVPGAKPERLGRVIKRLSVCYREDIAGKIALADEVLHTLFEVADGFAVAFSGGRDSLVALHLARKINPDIPVMLVNTGIEFPESLIYVRQLAEKWNLNYHEVKPHVNFWSLVEEQGVPVAGRGNTTFMKDLAQRADVKLSNSCCRRMKETPARQFYREHRTEGVVTGLRVDESLMRKLNFADYGALRYSSTYETLVSWPLYAWTSQDIADYIQANDLPLNPLYSQGYGRVGCWACMQDMFYKDSRLFTLQQQHPKLYATMRKKFGGQMIRLLSAWAELDEFDFQEEHLEGLYTACSFELLDEYRKSKRSRDQGREPSE
jgi:3'-phosphoadenosine 5'-phosphosulfate sulfotransferase (PAPS reductase)/FAD synthetase